MDKEKLRHLLENAKALEDAMKYIYRMTNASVPFSFSNYKTFIRKYNDIAIRVAKEVGNDGIFDIYDLEKVPNWGDILASQDKMYFDGVFANLAILRSVIENRLGKKEEEILNLKNFFASNLRRAVIREPENETYIQDVIEQLLIGRGLSKGIDYDREVGRIKVSIKEFKPDFIFPKLDLALEVKLSKSVIKSREIVDEINADIKAYSKDYSQILFVVYDLGTIRDENEYKSDLDNQNNVQLVVVKH